MATRRFRSRTTISRPSRKFVWARAEFLGSQGAGSLARTNLLSSFETAYGADVIGSTVVRIRGYLAVEGTAGDRGIFGAMVEAEPGTLDPLEDGPIVRPHADWMLYEPMIRLTNAPDPQARMIDVKSQRKLEEIDEQLSIYFGTPGANTAEMSFYAHLSIGLKLS